MPRGSFVVGDRAEERRERAEADGAGERVLLRLADVGVLRLQLLELARSERRVFGDGSVNAAERWNTYSSSACSAITGIDCTPDEPVPMTATRLPVKSKPPFGKRLV